MASKANVAPNIPDFGHLSPKYPRANLDRKLIPNMAPVRLAAVCRLTPLLSRMGMMLTRMPMVAICRRPAPSISIQ